MSERDVWCIVFPDGRLRHFGDTELDAWADLRISRGEHKYTTDSFIARCKEDGYVAKRYVPAADLEALRQENETLRSQVRLSREEAEKVAEALLDAYLVTDSRCVADFLKQARAVLRRAMEDASNAQHETGG